MKCRLQPSGQSKIRPQPRTSTVHLCGFDVSFSGLEITMSEINSYKHSCIGIVHCPSTFEVVSGNDTHRNIPIYRLDEDAWDGDSFQGKQGDLLLGGGSGESPALRISIPEAFSYRASDDKEVLFLDGVCQAYWSMNDAFVFCEGYSKLGWTPKERIESWLLQHIVGFLIREHTATYPNVLDSIQLTKYGSICRLPSSQEKGMS